MADISEMEQRLSILEKRNALAIEKEQELNRIAKLPFYKRIQAEGFEEMLKQTEETQKHSFEKICKREEIHKKDWYDEFILFWTGFLKGEFKSINQYLKRKNLKS